MSHVFTVEERRAALIASQGEEARERRRATLETKRRLLEEDIVLLWTRGMVPLAIAAKVRTTVDRVSAVIREAGFEIPGYLTTGGPMPDAETCPHCGKTV